MSRDGRSPDGGDIRVFVMDLLCISPFYDRYLLENLRALNPQITFGAISFHLDREYFARHHIEHNSYIVDVVARMGVPSATLRRGFKFIEYLLNLVILSTRFSMRPPDLIHTQWTPLLGTVPFEMWFLRLMKRRGIRLVHTVHNVLPHDGGTARHKRAYGKLYGLVDGVVCHTRETRRRLVEEFGVAEDDIAVIPHGPLFADTDDSGTKEAGDENQKRADPEVAVALFLGVIRPYKGLEFLLESWARFKAKGGQGRLLIVGRGRSAYVGRLSSSIKALEVADSVELRPGFVPNEQLRNHYLDADLVVLPYADISQSGALLTAMAFAKAVVVTDVGGFRETIEHGRNGYLVSYGDIDGFAGALDHLLASPTERHRLGLAARIDTEREYSWRTIASQTVQWYSTIMGI